MSNKYQNILKELANNNNIYRFGGRMLNDYYNVSVQLGLSKSVESMSYIVNELFSGIDFNGKRVLDIGGGTGKYSFFASLKGAKEVINLEPVSDGSNPKMVSSFNEFKSRLGVANVRIVNKTFQEYNENVKYDIIIIKSSINHLDEDACRDLHINNESKKVYMSLLSKLYKLTNIHGKVIISDCSRYNIWPLLNLKNPFSPSIEWNIHQSPNTWKKLLENVGYNVDRIHWGGSYRRLGKLGKLFLYNKIASYFLNSHFDIYCTKNCE